MDPFTIATGIVGVLGLTIQLSQVVNTYTQNAKNATKTAAELSTSLTVLESTLKHLDAFLRNENAINNSFEYTSVLCCATAACKTRLDLLYSKFSKHNGSRINRGIENLKWPFNEQENRTAVKDLQGFIQTFQFSLTIDGCALLSKTSNEVSEILKTQLETFKRLEEIPSYFSTLSINVSRELKQVSQILDIVASLPDTSLQLHEISGSIQRVEQKLEDHTREQEGQAMIQKREECLKWLSAPEYQQMHNDVCARRLQDTGQWLLEKQEFQTWQTDQQSANTLWCYGIPGAGKTILSSLVIDQLRKSVASQDVAVAFFYFDYQSQDYQSPATVVASLLKQLTTQKPTLPLPVLELYEQFKKQRDYPQLQDLENTLLSVLREFSQVFLVFDALDECDAKKHRKPFLKVLKQLSSTCAKVFVTSRPHPDDIKKALYTYPQIKIEASDSDIRKYLAHKIDQDSDADLIDQQLKDEIVSSIVHAAQGMFLLPALQIQTILDQTTKKRIRRALKDLPKELDATLKKTLDRINQQPESRAELGMRTLMWISYARRPILVKELCQALAVNLGETYLDEDDCPLAKHMVDYSLGLVAIDEESSIIRLVHFSVQEYFREYRKQVFPAGEQTIAEACLTYLLFEEFGKGSCTNDTDLDIRLQKYPFLNYSAHYWGFHTRDCIGEQGGKLALDFLRHDRKLACSIQIMHVSAQHHGNGYSQNFPNNHGGLHTAAAFGLDVLVAVLLTSHGVEPDSNNSVNRTPLSYAAEHGHLAVVQQLLDCTRVQPNSEDSGGWTPLFYAASNGHEAVVKLLAGCKGVDLDAKDSKFGRTILSYAAEHGREAVVEFLIGVKAINPNAKDIEFGRTPLSYASANGYDTIVRRLLERVINVDSQSKDGHTPLSLAVKNMHKTVVELLLDKAVDTNSVDTENGLTPLLWAVKNMHEGLVKLLLSKAVNVNGKSRYGWTPLSGAVEARHRGIIKMLLERKEVDVNLEDEYGCTPLSRAADQGDRAIVELLLEYAGIDVESKDKYGRTPLSRAADKGHDGVVRLLIDHRGVNTDCKDNHGQTPLSRASERGHEAVVMLLLESDAINPNSKDEYGQTPLSRAAEEGQEAVVRILLKDHRVDVSLEDRDGRTPFSWATERNHRAVAKLILGHLSINIFEPPELLYSTRSKTSFHAADEVVVMHQTPKDTPSRIDLDSIIDRLLEVRANWWVKTVVLLKKEMRYLCTKAREIFLSQPSLLELKTPLNICGDLRAQYSSLLRVFECRGFPSQEAGEGYLFLGNYVNRGKEPLETICLLLAYKIKYPENFFMLRGTHEWDALNRIYGFYDVCKRRRIEPLWKDFNDCFNCMPFAAIIDDSIFAVHAGLSPDLHSLDQIRHIKRPTGIPDCGLLCDLLFGDPDAEIEGWSENEHGVSFTFGPDVVSRFLQKQNLSLICRGHRAVEDGYEYFSDGGLVTLFTAPNYAGEFDNCGAIMSVDINLVCSFHSLKPLVDGRFR